MHVRRIRLKKKYRLRFWLSVSLIVLLCLILIPGPRKSLGSLFPGKNINYQQVYSKKLNDRIVDYSVRARLAGVGKSSDADDIRQRVSAGQLKRVRSNRYYLIENLRYSYPYLTRNSKSLLEEIGKKFREKTDKEGFKGSRIIVTSMTRTSENSRHLGRSNINASDNSPHLNGNAFDISYARFSYSRLFTSESDKWYMKEALAEVIYQLKEENRCWATYERKQGCFHVVSR
jgi:hypothetical protein